MPTLDAKLARAQDRVSSLTDTLQDALYTAKHDGLPSPCLYDLKRTVELSESIFYTLGTIRTVLRPEPASPEP